ncbi:HNH endonuclease [Mycena venus]|uniref:HNH endonuclease n=1 Tax=Mycena venus TaxID=2733690 RepID=A0A8H6Y8R9_9AGAR|nr:HNH endonuclease [Mycena venus]
MTPLYVKTEVQLRAMEARPSTDHKTAKKHALVRDGFKCLLSGKYDLDQTLKSSQLTAKAKTELSVVSATNCAHIFPVSLNPSKASLTDHSANVWQVLKMLGGLGTEFVDSLNGAGINQLGNILTLLVTLHEFFDRLMLWLEKVEGQENTYKTCYPQTGILDLDYLPATVTFSTSTGFPLPRADLLAVHAAACCVAHLSGAAEFLEMREDDDDDEVSSIMLSLADFISKVNRHLRRAVDDRIVRMDDNQIEDFNLP